MGAFDMGAITDIQERAAEGDRIVRDAAVRLHALLTSGTRVEFKYGNMTHVQDAVVIRVCAYQGLGVILLPDGANTSRKVPVSALVETLAEPTQTHVVPLDLPRCDDCITGLPHGQDRHECKCGNIFVREGSE